MKRIDRSRLSTPGDSPDRFPGDSINRFVAKLVPVKGEQRPFVGRSRGVIQISDQDLLAPVSERWEVDADL